MNTILRPVLAVTLAAALAAGLFGCSREPRKASQEAPREAPNPLFFPKRWNQTAPAVYRAHFETSKGDFVIEVHRKWAPIGADRFYNLVRAGYYDDTRIYRVVPGFLVQFGVNGDPRVNGAWYQKYLPDDPVTESNLRGRVAFAHGGPNSRTTEIFISYKNNAKLDKKGFAPFGEVVEGMDVVDSFYGGYGDGPPRGEGPYGRRALALGNAYFDESFPKLDRILRAWIEGAGASAP